MKNKKTKTKQLQGNRDKHIENIIDTLYINNIRDHYDSYPCQKTPHQS